MTKTQEYELYFFADLMLDCWSAKERAWARDKQPSDLDCYYYDRAEMNLSEIAYNLGVDEESYEFIVDTIIYWAQQRVKGSLFLPSTFRKMLKEEFVFCGFYR